MKEARNFRAVSPAVAQAVKGVDGSAKSRDAERPQSKDIGMSKRTRKG